VLHIPDLELIVAGDVICNGVHKNTAVEFFNAKIERYPNYLGRTVLWAGASAFYGVREHPDQDLAQIVGAGFL